MDDGFSPDSVLTFLKRNLFLSGISLLGIVLLIVGFYFTREQATPESSVVFEAVEAVASGSSDIVKEPSTIFVDVGGAVQKPGVYEVDSEARVQEVLTKAGGLSEKADHQGIAQSINLAARLTDGQKIYFPHKGESQTAVAPQKATLGSSSTIGGLISLNNASQGDLESLPGIGEVTATKIISGRPYASVEDLKTKKIVGESVYGKIKDLVKL